MKFVIIGSGIIGLSVAKVLIDKKVCLPSKILVIDKYSIPSKGTSQRNSGVLHAGLYYKTGSLKAKLSIEGSSKLKHWCKTNNIEIMECGKLLVPFKEEDYLNLEKINKNAIENGCDVRIINYEEAHNIQPGLIKKRKYLWSPKTSVFSPEMIIQKLFNSLKELGVEFLKKSVICDDSNKKQLILYDNSKIDYLQYINCAGPGALSLSKTITDKFDHLTILPFLGQYVVQKSGINIKTNLYPVPDPELPFLGIHLTPRINKPTLIGPNAIPIFQKDIQGYDISDIRGIPTIFVNNMIFFLSNNCNYRKHALSELSFSLKNKFYKKSIRYLSSLYSKNFKIKMDNSTYGIRPQIINRNTHTFVNDFIYEKIEGNIHIVNAVSPAFTSCFSLAEYIVDKII